MTDGTGTTTWTYDSLHRLTSMTDGAHKTVSYTYDLRGLPTRIVYPNGETVTRQYDAAGRWTATTDWLGNKTTFRYDADGDLTKERIPSSKRIVDTFVYDDADRLMAIRDKRRKKTIFAATYGRDGNGQMVKDRLGAGTKEQLPVHGAQPTLLRRVEQHQHMRCASRRRRTVRV